MIKNIAVKILLAFVFAGLFACGAIANYSITWSQTDGPYTGKIKRLQMPTVEGTELIIASNTNKGIFRTEDSAENWSNVSGVGTIVTLDPADPNVVYAAYNVYANGLKMSSDEGVTWGDLPGVAVQTFGSLNATARNIVVDPRDHSNIYVTTWDDIFHIDLDDPSPAWTSIRNGISSDINNFASLYIEPRKSYIFVNGSHLVSHQTFSYRSTDEGQSWQSITVKTVYGSSFLPSDIYCYAGGDLHISTNEGDSWQPRSISPFSKIRNINVADNFPDVIYALLDDQLRVSTDGGQSWAPAYFSLPAVYFPHAEFYFASVVVPPDDPDAAYLAVDGDGVYKTVDRGQNWVRKSSGFLDSYVIDLAFDSSSNSVFAGTGPLVGSHPSGLWRSDDEGASWNRLREGFFTVNSLYYVKADKTNPGHVYTGGPGVGMYKSVNGGGSFSSLNLGLSNLDVTRIIVDYSTSESRPKPRVYVSTLGEGVFFGEVGASGVASWTQLPKGGLANTNVLAICVDSTTEGHSIYAGTESGGVFRFELDQTGTATWEQRDPISGGGIPDSATIRDIAVSPTDVNNIFVSTLSGLFDTEDRGVSWDNTRYNNSPTYGLYIDEQTDPNLLYVCTHSNGIMRGAVGSGDVLVTTGFDGSKNPRDISRAHDDPTFYVGTYLYGVIKGTPDLGPTHAPTDFGPLSVSTDSISWAWNDVATTEFGYRFYRMTPPPSTSTNLPYNSEGYVESGLTQNTVYARRVSAYNAGSENFSNTSSECTLAVAPSNLRIVEALGDRVRLNWDINGNPSPETIYVMEATTELTGAFSPGITIPLSGQVPPQYFTGLEPNTSYRFRVYAVNQRDVTTEAVYVSGSTIHETNGPTFRDILINDMEVFQDEAYTNPFPLITANITDETPPIPRESVTLDFSGIYFVNGNELDQFYYNTPEAAYTISHRLKVPLGAGSYDLIMYARDSLGNLGASTPITLHVASGFVQLVGVPLVYPTPFSPGRDGSAIFAYTLNKDADIQIYMFSVEGKNVLTRKFSSGVNGGRAGYNEVYWDGQMDTGGIVANGIYVYRIVSDKKVVATGKMVVFE